MNEPPTRQSVSVEIALAVARVGTGDYFGLIRAIEAVLDRFGIKHMQCEKHRDQIAPEFGVIHASWGHPEHVPSHSVYEDGRA